MKYDVDYNVNNYEVDYHTKYDVDYNVNNYDVEYYMMDCLIDYFVDYYMIDYV